MIAKSPIGMFIYSLHLIYHFTSENRIIRYCIDFGRYKYKFLRAITSNLPSSVIKDNRGSKLTIGRGGMLKAQHLVSVSRSATSHPHIDSSGHQQTSRIAYIEFFVKPEVDEDTVNNS